MQMKFSNYKIILCCILIFSILSLKSNRFVNKGFSADIINYADTNKLSFFVIGDWGQRGSEKQLSVANAMQKQATKEPINFIISVGDNFYPRGVKSIKDSSWIKSFENVYNAKDLQVPWYTAFGNHDYMGKIKPQLNYHKKNPLWKTTERYYSFEQRIPGTNEFAIFIFIDTNPFDGTMGVFGYGSLVFQNNKKQLKWLDKTLKETKAKWKIVIGHHPLYTTGMRRGLMLDVRNAFLPYFEKYKVDVYLAGHDHDLQHQKPEGHTNYFVSGAGSDIRGCTSDSLQTKFAKADYGFMQIDLKSDTFNLRVINNNGLKLYQTKIIK
jgi:predicted phosphodiesterase